ncbi:hypothetical protein GO292_04661 [Ralstonia solanacearum]|nr:hypothetical protein [Ralstonia solanacearum]
MRDQAPNPRRTYEHCNSYTHGCQGGVAYPCDAAGHVGRLSPEGAVRDRPHSGLLRLRGARSGGGAEGGCRQPADLLGVLQPASASLDWRLRSPARWSGPQPARVRPGVRRRGRCLARSAGSPGARARRGSGRRAFRAAGRFLSCCAGGDEPRGIQRIGHGDEPRRHRHGDESGRPGYGAQPRRGQPGRAGRRGGCQRCAFRR